MLPDAVEYFHIEQDIAGPCQAPIATVMAPAGWLWSHPRLTWWAAWLRRLGWRGRVPAWARRTCFSTYPDYFCPCGAYRLLWKDLAPWQKS
jgi:hypothetical protein